MARHPNFKIPDKPRDRPTVPQVKPLVKRIYDGECKSGLGAVGGCLHVELDDGNIRNHFLEAALTSAWRDLCPLCREVVTLMLQMTMTQRRKVRSFL